MNRRIKTTATIRTQPPPPATPAIKPMGRPVSSVLFSVIKSTLFSPVEVVIETVGEVVIETDGLVFETFELDVFVG